MPGCAGHGGLSDQGTGDEQAPGQALGRKRESLALLAIAIITFAVYIPSLSFGFVYDHAQIVETSALSKSDPVALG
jgi:hypothetical protein